MILNNADNMMFGSSEIDRVYCGSVKVWERGGGNIPQEVLDNVDDLIDHYSITGNYTFAYGLDTDAYGNDYYFVMLFASTAPAFRVTSRGNLRDESCTYYFRSQWTDVTYNQFSQGGSFHGALPIGMTDVYCTFDVSNITNASTIIFTEVS